jgi:hypothetical protein
MANYPPFASPQPRAQRPIAAPRPAEPEYPSIDEFLDELPPIEDFLTDHAEPEQQVEKPVTPAAPRSAVPQGDEWLAAGWKSYDFSSLTELSNRTPIRPMPAVVITETQSELARQSYSTSAPGPSADEVAEALDGIARRIRSGELVIDNLQGTPPEAAMAAAIAALLRMRG